MNEIDYKIFNLGNVNLLSGKKLLNTKLAYKTLQQGKSLAGLAQKGISSKLMEMISPHDESTDFSINPQIMAELQKAIKELEEIDWKEAEEGIYPKSQLFEAPWLEWASKYPMVWLDMPSTWNRRKKSKTRDIPKAVDKELYPDY